MGKKISELSYEERVLIYKFASLGASRRAIGRTLGRHHTTICRELNRNPSNDLTFWENARAADRLSRERKSSRGRKSKFRDVHLGKFVADKLKLRWTPEIIAGRLSITEPEGSITGQSIYNYIYSKAPQLIKLLARKGKRRKRALIRATRKKPKFTQKTPISKRPKYIEKRKQLGHWEIDTAVSKKSRQALLVMTERATRVTFIEKLELNNSATLKKVLTKRLKHLPKELRRTFTYDNGSENALHHEINNDLGTKSFFCDAYASWQKGSVENKIGRIRRFIPKGTDYRNFSKENIAQLEDIINNTPMKLHKFKTPNEVLRGAIKCLI